MVNDIKKLYKHGLESLNYAIHTVSGKFSSRKKLWIGVVSGKLSGTLLKDQGVRNCRFCTCSFSKFPPNCASLQESFL